MSQGGSWGWTNPDVQPIEQPPSGPSRRQVGLVAMATLAVAVGLLAFTILGANNGGNGSALNPIAQAAERTASFPGERVSITGSYLYPGISQSVPFQGGGAFNGDTQQGRVTLHIDATGPVPSIDMYEVDDATDIYLSSPIFAGQLPDGKSWMKLSASTSDSASTAPSGQADPGEQLKLMEQVSDAFTIVGEETVRGHETTHYSASISYQKAADQLRSEGDDDGADVIEALAEKTGSSGFPVEVWIDSKKLVRRATLSIPIPIGDDQTFTMNMTQEFFDFGAKPRIVLPPESQVYDATDDAAKALDDLTS
jgi:hypothetical protein